MRCWSAVPVKDSQQCQYARYAVEAHQDPNTKQSTKAAL